MNYLKFLFVSSIEDLVFPFGHNKNSITALKSLVVGCV